MGTLYLQNCVFLVKKVPKRTPRKIIKFRKGAPREVLRSIEKSVSVFSHGGDGGSKPPGTTSNIKHLCISWSGTRWVLFPFCSHFSDPAARTCWVLFCPRKPYLGFSMVESHQIDGLGKLLVADASITFTYASRLRTVAKDTLLNLRVHS